MSAIRQDGDAVRVDILVQPRASRAKIGPMHGERIKVAVTAPPVDGAANAAVIQLWSRALKRPKRDVQVVTGPSSRRKTVRIAGVKVADVEAIVV